MVATRNSGEEHMRQSPLRVAASVLVSLMAMTWSAARADAGFSWPQWGQNPQHQGVASVNGQSVDATLADFVYDPFVAQERQDQAGDLVVHYQAPLLRGNDVFM